MEEIFGLIKRHKKSLAIVAVIPSVYYIYQLGIHFGDFIYLISH